jgi:hypothetical protein
MPWDYREVGALQVGAILDVMKQEDIEALAKEMAKGVKTEAGLEAVTRILTKTLIETALKARSA